MFSKGKNTVQVLKTLDLGYEEVKQYFEEYLSLKKMNYLIQIFDEYERFIPFLTRILEKMKQYKQFDTDVNALVDYLNEFKALDNKKIQLQHDKLFSLKEKMFRR